VTVWIAESGGFNLPQVLTCMVELFEIASNITHTLDEGF